MHVQADTPSRRTRHEPMRMCVICRSRLPKRELNRYVAPGAGTEGGPVSAAQPMPDAAQRLTGRGFYVCGRSECGQKFATRGWGRKTRKGVVHG